MTAAVPIHTAERRRSTAPRCSRALFPSSIDTTRSSGGGEHYRKHCTCFPVKMSLGDATGRHDHPCDVRRRIGLDTDDTSPFPRSCTRRHNPVMPRDCAKGWQASTAMWATTAVIDPPLSYTIAVLKRARFGLPKGKRLDVILPINGPRSNPVCRCRNFSARLLKLPWFMHNSAARPGEDKSDWRIPPGGDHVECIRTRRLMARAPKSPGERSGRAWVDDGAGPHVSALAPQPGREDGSTNWVGREGIGPMWCFLLSFLIPFQILISRVQTDLNY